MNIDSRQPADDLACRVAGYPPIQASVPKDHLGGKRFVNVVDQCACNRASIEVDELAAELVRERGVATHPLLLLRALLSGPD